MCHCGLRVRGVLLRRQHAVADDLAPDILKAICCGARTRAVAITACNEVLLAGETRRQFVAESMHYRITKDYHSVSIVPGAGACNAARDLQGHRFLSREAHQLPLPSCPLSTCHCVYRHYDDRRQKRRRKMDRTELPQFWSGLERRQLHERRMADLP